jgi:hypothetical protein
MPESTRSTKLPKRGCLALLLLCNLGFVPQPALAAMEVSRSEGVQIITTRRAPPAASSAVPASAPQASALSGRGNAPDLAQAAVARAAQAAIPSVAASDERELVKRALAEEQRGMNEAIANYARASKAGASPETLAPLEREVRARLQKIDMLMRAPH